MIYIKRVIWVVLGLLVVMILFITGISIWSYANPEKLRSPIEVTVESFAKLTSITGQIGDTLGGVIGVVLGFITLIYVIDTFRDQSQINNHSKSADNLHIILDLLKESSEITKSFTFEGKNGSQAFDFARKYLSLPLSNIPKFFSYTSNILDDTLPLFESILLIMRIEKNLHIDKEHQRVIGLKINELIKEYMPVLSYIGENYIKLCEYANEEKKVDFIYAVGKLKLFLNEAQELGILRVIHDDEIEIVDTNETTTLTMEEFVKSVNDSYLEEVYSKLEMRAFKVNLVDKKNASF